MLKGLKNFKNKPARVVTGSFDRTGKFDETSVVLVQSVKNMMKFPKGASITAMGIDLKDEANRVAMAMFPHYFDAELTFEVLTELNADVAAKVKEAGQVLFGSEIISKIETGEFHKLMPDEAKAELIASLEDGVEYPIISLIMQKDLDFEISEEAYNELDKDTKAEYSYRKKEKIATLEGAVGKDGGFSAAGAYVELGGTSNAFANEECTEVVAAADINVEAQQYTKQTVLGLSEAIDFGEGEMAHIAYTTETVVRKSKKGQVRTSTKDEVAVTDAITEGETQVNSSNEALDLEV